MKTMKKSTAVIVLLLTVLALLGLGSYVTKIVKSTAIKQAGTTATESVEESTEAEEASSEEASEAEVNAMKLGLDLSGGVSVTYEIVDDNPTQEQINDTISKMEERAATYNDEYSVYQEGEDRITVEIPGVDDADEVLESLGTPGSLYFIAQKDSDGNANYSYNSSTGAYELTDSIENLIEKGAVVLTGDEVQDASAVYQSNSTYGTNEPVVSITLNDEGTEAFATATEAAYAAGESIGIYYDGRFVSVPSVNSVISDGKCVIEGMSSFEEADQLATYIRIGAIDLQLQELQFQIVGASLGSNALSASVKAAMVGLALVMIFMIVIYALPGVAASLALAIYTSLVVFLIWAFEIVLTLPGIAGVILGIGMAVDANVIIFARIREEIASGKTVGTAISEGYKKAFSAILDGNITTFIAAIVLHFLGSGTVRGFANTLMISIVVSMFTALVVTRFIMVAFYQLGAQNEKLYGRAKERTAVKFIENRVKFFAVSIIVIVAGFVGMIGFNASEGKALNYSVEFQGGTSTTADFGKEYTIEEIESEIIPYVEEITGDSDVHATNVSNSTEIVIKTRTLNEEERSALTDSLVKNFQVDESSVTSESISSTISNEMRTSAVLAVVVACIFMLLYIWFRFKDIRFASSAIAALVHDVLVVLTAYALIRISVGNTFIACMLTIVGYSINDTIVVFDRIRENMKTVKVQTPEILREVGNRSLTQTVGRSINTSITTIIMIVCLYAFGSSAIREFALPLLIGMLSGTYSSIFIATNLWYLFKVHFSKNVVKTEK